MQKKKEMLKIYADFLGAGISSNINHIITPEINGAILAMKNAIYNSKIIPEEINYINAHGTSTKSGDLNEANAIYKIFKNHVNHRSNPNIQRRVKISNLRRHLYY